MRKLAWRDEKAFHGVACSACGWVMPNPSMDLQNRNKKEWKIEIRRRFEAHECEKYPLKPKRVTKKSR